jgi:hypothetical protein
VKDYVSGEYCVKHQRETLCDAEALMYVFESKG